MPDISSEGQAEECQDNLLMSNINVTREESDVDKLRFYNC